MLLEIIIKLFILILFRNRDSSQWRSLQIQWSLQTNTVWTKSTECIGQVLGYAWTQILDSNLRTVLQQFIITNHMIILIYRVFHTHCNSCTLQLYWSSHLLFFYFTLASKRWDITVVDCIIQTVQTVGYYLPSWSI